jgi:hypothetical protein
MNGLSSLKINLPDMKEFIGKLDAQMRAKNIYYDDLVSGEHPSAFENNSGSQKRFY